MKHNFFSNCTTLIELRKQYINLAKKHHSDVGGDDEIMKKINAEYEYMTELLNNGNDPDEAIKEKYKNSIFVDIIENLINLNGLTIEIIGSWLWVTGDTYTHRETLKAVQMKYSKNKKAWYWSMETKDSTTKTRGYRTLNNIRSTFGSEKIEANRPSSILLGVGK